jgi:NADPH:quinone reductase-like Zn-dependent oxidoreductase
MMERTVGSQDARAKASKEICMKAIVYRKYGSPDVLEYRDADKPVPKDDEVLIKIEAAALNAYDWHLMRGKPFVARMSGGLSKPKNTILGEDVAGRIEAVGPKAGRFKPGQEVFGDLASCGSGGFAEYARARENVLGLKPAGLSFEQAAAVPMAAVTALQGLRDKGGTAPGKKVLINGAGGGVGTYAVQIAKAFGAEVTAVCGPGSQELARSLGADRVLDYTKTDLARDGRRYDLILAVNGDRQPSEYLRALNPGGICVVCGGSNKQIFQSLFLGPWLSLGRRRKIGVLMARMNSKDLGTIAGLLEAGKVKPVIDRRYPLSETAAAMRYLEEGHAKGKVVITM